MTKEEERVPGQLPQVNPESSSRRPTEGAGGSDVNHFSANQFWHEPIQRHGDLFPLPMPEDGGFPGNLAELSSRRAIQRVAKRRLLLQQEKAAVRSLNVMAGFEDESTWPMAPRNFAQKSSLSRVRAAVCSRPPPAERESPQAALRQLLSKKVGSEYGLAGTGPGQLASYQRGKVSLPADQQDPVQISSLLPPLEKAQVEDFERQLLLSEEERAAVLEKGLKNDLYMDPILANSKKEYHAFIADLCRSQLLNFTITPRVQVGAFFVSKKSGKLRLIIDARRANKLFRTPPSTLLGSVDCWTRMESEEGSQVFLAQEDVRDFFYRLAIPKELGEFFALPAIDPHLLKAELGHIPSEVAELIDKYDSPIFPHLQVLPMGFAWAFHLAHQAHVHLAQCTLPQAGLLLDRRPSPVLGKSNGESGTGVLIYADNGNHLGVDAEAVSRDQSRMIQALHERGLQTHELTESSTLGESLGVRLNGAAGLVTATPARDWRLYRALQALVEGRVCISGEELEVVVGHITMRALLNRNSMGILRHTYVFVRQCYHHRRRLWRSVIQELEVFRGLLPLIHANIFAPWDGEPLCTDACLSGYAVVQGEVDRETVAAIGRSDERWRFRRGEGSKVAPRAVALAGADPLSDVRTVKPEVDGEVFAGAIEDEEFPEVPPHVFQEKWKTLWNSEIHFKEPVHLIEARSILGAVRHRSRDHYRHGHRILIFNDNLGVVLACQKGRCSSYPLLRIIRRIAAHSLAAGLKIYVRWVPSEFNVADGPSRAWETKAVCGRRTVKGEAKEKGRDIDQEGSRESKQESEEPSQGRGESWSEKIKIPVKNEGFSSEQLQQGAEASFEVSGEEACEGTHATSKISEEVES